MGPISGADESLVTYATQLKRAGHDVSVLTLYPHPSADQYEEPLKEAGVEVLRITDHKVHVLLAFLRNATRHLSHFANGSQRFLHKDAERITRRIAKRYVSKCHEYFNRSKADIVHVLTPDAATPVLIDASKAANVPVIYQEMGTRVATFLRRNCCAITAACQLMPRTVSHTRPGLGFTDNGGRHT